MATSARQVTEHGQQIFIYCHVRTKQVIYSLSRSMRNHDALKQLPFLGKKTVPAKLRKDFWRPLATVVFPSGHQGLKAYQELREFRVRHEHEWTMEQLGVKTRKDAGRALQNQKANSIADLAAILTRQAEIAEKDQEYARTVRQENEQAISKAHTRRAEIRAEMHQAKLETMRGSTESWERYKTLKNERIRLRKALEKPSPANAIAGKYDTANDTRSPGKYGLARQRGKPQRERLMSVDGLKIMWADLLDAEYASTWPETVTHDVMPRPTQRTRNYAASPTDLEEAEAEDEVAEVAADMDKLALPEPGQTIQAEPPPPPSRLDRIVARLRDGA